jgi:hypothetical protein
LNPRPHEAQLKDQKVKKSSRSSSRRRKKMQGQQKTRKSVNQAKWQRKAKISSKLKQNEQEKLKLKSSP